MTLCECLRFPNNSVALYRNLFVSQHVNHLKWQLVIFAGFTEFKSTWLGLDAGPSNRNTMEARQYSISALQKIFMHRHATSASVHWPRHGLRVHYVYIGLSTQSKLNVKQSNLIAVMALSPLQISCEHHHELDPEAPFLIMGRGGGASREVGLSLSCSF